MFDYWDDEQEELTTEKLTHVYKLRHFCNVYGRGEVAKTLNVPLTFVKIVYESKVHGSKELKQFLEADEQQFNVLIQLHESETQERDQKKREVQRKNEELIEILKKKRLEFAGVGTNKAKRRLNKLALVSPQAKAIRVALEVEDKNISAKDSYYPYVDKIYRMKQKFILELCEVFQEQNWVYGIQKSDVPGTTHVIYFEIPECEQISWHISLEKKEKDSFPPYEKEWDGKQNSTLDKLEVLAMELFENSEKPKRVR